MRVLRPVLPVVLALSACEGSDRDAPSDSDDTALGDTDVPVAPVADAGPDRELAVGGTVVFEATENTVGEVAWDLGDGTIVEGRRVEHTYTEPGNLLVIQQVIGAGGTRDTATARVTVYRPAVDPQPVSASPMVLSDDGAFLYVAQPESGTVVRVATADQATARWPACATPRSVALDGSLVAAACEDDDAVAILDASTGDLQRTVPLDPGCLPVALVVRNGTFHTACSGTGEIVRFTATGVPEVTRTGLEDPRGLALLGDGTYVTTRFRGNVGHHDLFGDPTGGGRVDIGDTPVTLAPDPGPDSDTANRGTPNLLQALAVSPDGGSAYIGATVANLDRGLASDGLPATFETTLRAAVRLVDVPNRAEVFALRNIPDNHGTVGAITLTPRGNWAWVALQNTHTLQRLDAYTLQSSDAVLNAGSGIDGLAVSPDGRTLYAHAWLDREVRAFDLSGAAASEPPRLWSAPTVTTEPLPAEVLRGKVLFHSAVDRRMAKDGYQSCSACHPFGTADGLTWDFTQRGEGLRNTIWLNGHGGTDQGPVHWTGNFDEIHDFEGDIRNGQGGDGLLSDTDWAATADSLGPAKAGLSADLDALAAFVSALDTFPVSPFAAPSGGAQAFADAGCDTCHDPARGYTDSVLAPDPADYVRHDVGTWTDASGTRLAGCYDGFDTPTLRGTWQTAPYLHDGSAPTLEDAIRAHRPVVYDDADCDGIRGDLVSEADTTGLDPDTITQLADFVRSL